MTGTTPGDGMSGMMREGTPDAMRGTTTGTRTGSASFAASGRGSAVGRGRAALSRTDGWDRTA